MGIKDCNKILWHANGLTLQSVKDLNMGRRIDVDGNLMAYQIGLSGGGGRSIQDVIHDMAMKLKRIAHSGGFRVNIIIDGDVRPDCKRATLLRMKQNQLDDVNRRFCRLRTMELHGRVNSESGASESDIEMYKTFSTAADKLEKKCHKRFKIPKNIDFYQVLSEKLFSVGAFDTKEGGGCVEAILKAKFQADTVIASRFNKKKCDLILSSDSDFAALLGNECILITEIKETGKKRGRKRKEDGNMNSSMISPSSFAIKLAGSSNAKMKKLKDLLEISQEGFHSEAIWNEAKCPLLEDEPLEMRALIALCLGCDVMNKGIRGMGSTGMIALIKKIKEKARTIVDGEESSSNILPESQTSLSFCPTTRIECESIMLLKKEMSEKLKADLDVINTLVSALIFEPGIIDERDIGGFGDDACCLDIILEEGENTDSEGHAHPYVLNPPTKLPKFLESFSNGSACIDIFDGPEISHCSGTCFASKHSYLAYEQSHECTSCAKSFCEHCIFNPKEDVTKAKVYYNGCKNKLCLDCFASDRIDGNKSAELAENESPPLNEMRRQLNKNNALQISDKLSIAQTIELYDAYIASPSNPRKGHQDAVRNNVKYPLLPSKALDGKHSDMRSIGSFEISDGGNFISNKDLVSDENLAAVMDLMSSFVRYDNSKLVHTSSNDVGRYGYFPTNLLNFAFLSRVDSGHRLLARCARHAMDPKTPSIKDQQAELFEYKTEGELIFISL